MTNLLISLVAAVTLLVAADFFVGLIKLWNAAAPVAIEPTPEPTIPAPVFSEIDEWATPVQPITFATPVTIPTVTQYLLSPAVDVEVAETPIINYSTMTIRELKAIAKNTKLKGYSKMLKNDLVAALQAI